MVTIAQEHKESLTHNKDLFQAIKEYVEIFIQEIFAKREKLKNERLNEEDLLEYFKKNSFVRENFKQVLEKHLAYIKEVRKDIIETWEHYKAFLKIK